jgi:predicted dinucleotide-binding enzyme
MKIGIIGVGNVGCACAMAAVIRGSAREVILVNRTRKTAQAVVNPRRPRGDLCAGGVPQSAARRRTSRGGWEDCVCYSQFKLRHYVERSA